MARIEEQQIPGAGEGRVLLVPPMEPYGAPFVAAVFRSIGYDARVLTETAETLGLGLKHTGGGECVPCPTTVGALIKTMREENLSADKVIFFMPTACGPCRFGQYAKLDSIIFEKLGWSGIRIMSPSAENAYAGLDLGARQRLWHGIIVGDVLRKLAMKVRPYEKEKGKTDVTVGHWLNELVKVFERPDISSAGSVLAKAVDEVGRIPRRNEKRPLVGVVGEIYVRSDPFVNGDVCRRIEELGGEAALAPVGEWILYTNHLKGLIVQEQQRGLKAVIERVKSWLETNFFFERVEHKYYEIAEPLLYDRKEYPIAEVMAEGGKYIPWQFEGEALLTLGRAAFFVQRDGAKAVVNASPMFCMPGTITSSIFPQLERELNVPIVCNFYDGSGDPNRSLVPVMHYLRTNLEAAQHHHTHSGGCSCGCGGH